LKTKSNGTDSESKSYSYSAPSLNAAAYDFAECDRGTAADSTASPHTAADA
jgi:hypothetical protein